jgi:tetratricopeptide (TPR) repeat protein
MLEPLIRPKDVPGPAWFGRFNFQREEDVARLTGVLIDGPSVVLLSGEAGIGRRYLLQAAIHRLREASQTVEILEIDLEGYDEEVHLGKYFELQVEKRRKEKGAARKELVDALVSAMRLGVKGTGWASVLSMTLSLKEPIAALTKLLVDRGQEYSGELFSAREIAASILGSLAGKVILHVIDPALFHAIPSPENPRRWLPEVVERFPHATLVISCGPNGESEDLVPGAWREPERIDLHRLDEGALRSILDLRYEPNEFPSDLAGTLIRYSHGIPGFVGGVAWLLAMRGALEEDERRIWRIDDPKAAEVLSEGLLEPVSQALHEHPGHTKALWTFLLDATLCGELVPVSLLVAVQALEKEEQDDLVDLIDEVLVDGLGLLEDLGYSHPGFPSVSVARFRGPIVRLAVLEHFNPKERRTRAAQIVPALRRGLPIATRTVARLFMTLADHFSEADRDEILRELQWWVGTDEADLLREGLAAALMEDRLKPESLWGALIATEGRWPPYRRLALLDAYGTGPRDEEGNSLGIPLERLGDFYYRRAELLYHLGRYSESLRHAEQAVGIEEIQRGRLSLEYFRATYLTGINMEKLGNFAHARRALQAALNIAQRILGPEHLEALLAKASLASVLEDEGELSAARIMYEEIVEAEVRVLGPEHWATLATKNNLALVLKIQGELSAARALYEEIIEAEIRVLGPEHPSILPAKGNLASVLKAQGELSAARALYDAVVEGEVRLRGPEHPETLTSKGLLASVLQAQGELSAARALYEDVVGAAVRVRGPEHPETLKLKSLLASVMRAQGDLSAARVLFEDIVGVEVRVRGSEHLEALKLKGLLASVLQAQGDLSAARALFEDVVGTLVRIRGPEYPEMLATKHALAHVLEEQGELSLARLMLEEVVEAEIRVRGLEHPETLRVKRCLSKIEDELARVHDEA